MANEPDIQFFHLFIHRCMNLGKQANVDNKYYAGVETTRQILGSKLKRTRFDCAD